MNRDEQSYISLKHTFVFAFSLVLGGVLIWIIQLARGGDPIGYVILTGLGVILVLPVVGLVLYMLIGAISKLQQNQVTHLDDVKTIYETQRVLRAQNQELARLLLQIQNNPALRLGSGQAHNSEQTLLPGQVSSTPVPLGPGQMITPEGFVIDGAAFDTLTDQENG